MFQLAVICSQFLTAVRLGFRKRFVSPGSEPAFCSSHFYLFSLKRAKNLIPSACLQQYSPSLPLPLNQLVFYLCLAGTEAVEMCTFLSPLSIHYKRDQKQWTELCLRVVVPIRSGSQLR